MLQENGDCVEKKIEGSGSFSHVSTDSVKSEWMHNSYR